MELRMDIRLQYNTVRYDTLEEFNATAIINCDTLSVFKSRLKNHLFNIAYS